MKLNKVFLALVIGASITSGAVMAANQGQGTITFKGSIIDAPCSISFQDANQTVELGQISKVGLLNSGSSVPRDFSITLEQCDVSAVGKKAKIAFTGISAANSTDLLAVSASAGDVGVAITDELANSIAINGTGWDSQPLVAGDNVLRFKAMLKTTSVAKPTINEGDFTGRANFALTYL
ncbi:MAG: type 1 fimbrial protein [Citrobacter amalonaticus]|jgi:type 1 fimbria pilin|nr:type 1 fimbrial protein [Citrobacter amalonaticus]